MVSSIPDIALEKSAYVLPEVPVVVGHYTLSGEPAALSERVVCVDYNAAKASHPLRAWIYDAGRDGGDKGALRQRLRLIFRLRAEL
ncbi:Uncharacterised protein [Raoultella terrigena]|uniref:Uncharacterized protein n=1 Tax=Raoultella terrigena TaxID=577 RepID=A0A4U9CYW7_RAOTE|nr:Uncharacterised protein [Raoultella terrigena]